MSYNNYLISSEFINIIIIGYLGQILESMKPDDTRFMDFSITVSTVVGKFLNHCKWGCFSTQLTMSHLKPSFDAFIDT